MKAPHSRWQKIKLILHTSDEPKAAAAGKSFATSVKYPFCFATNRSGNYGGGWHSGHGLLFSR